MAFVSSGSSLRPPWTGVNTSGNRCRTFRAKAGNGTTQTRVNFRMCDTPARSTSKQDDTEGGLNGSLILYIALAVAQGIPFALPQSGVAGDVTYFTVTAIACIIIGCRRAAVETVISEAIGKEQAVLAPFAASALLFGIYLLLKYTDVNIGLVLNGLTTFVGSVCLKEALDPLISSLLRAVGVGKRVLWKAKGDEKGVSAVTLDAMLSTIGALSITGLYLSGHWPQFLYSNLIAIAICTRVVALVQPASFLVGAGLLCGLFLYDIFWVFGSEVMVSVATQIDSPGKLLFPRAHSEGGYPYAILGLGDVCVPGLFASLAQSMDAVLSDGKWSPYFNGALTGYTVGLMTCFGVNRVTGSAQPALLYLVPAMIGGLLGVGLVRGQLKQVVWFRVEESGVEESEGKT